MKCHEQGSVRASESSLQKAWRGLTVNLLVQKVCGARWECLQVLAAAFVNVVAAFVALTRCRGGLSS